MTTDDIGFLRPAPESAAAERLFAHDREMFGFVMNLSRSWAKSRRAGESLARAPSSPPGSVVPGRSVAEWRGD